MPNIELKIEDFIIGECIYEIEPCVHYIECDKLGIKGQYDAEIIYTIFKHYDIINNHFNYCSSKCYERHRKLIHYPTPEEFSEDKRKEEERQIIAEKHRKEYEKCKKIQDEIDEKYANRLERLKIKNNVYKDIKTK